MPSMIELIRRSAVPASVMRLAAKGALSLPAPEMIEILVDLASHNKLFAEQASLTLAGWDEASARAASGDPATPKEVLDYLADPRNLRPVLLPTLLENQSVNEEILARVAASVSSDSVAIFFASARAGQSAKILSALKSNPGLTAEQTAKAEVKLASALAQTPTGLNVTVSQPFLHGVKPPDNALGSEEASDEQVSAFLKEHAAEITAEADKPFQPIGGIYDGSEAEATSTAEAIDPPAAEPVAAAAAQPAPAKRTRGQGEEERGSTLQKIARLGITGRIQLAMKGSKEERSLLIRDGTKIVALAVLDSPKISDGEVEKIASQKNVLEAVLRTIPMKRRYMKNYNIVRNLVFNPRTPLDVSLGLIKNLMTNDLKVLSGTKEVSETIRKLALRQFKQKSETSK